MRLLPFRVICVMGMNDGDFPRRDPAAGLNRLTAELGTDRRRHGDRSTRDDDRYLFLQLFAAAQDAFLVSWIGADPRDGSAREPSTVVSELLAAAAAYHEEVAPDALVLRHPLQPFAPAAFGGGEDERLFSYDAHWHPAAGSLSGARAPLGPWIGAGTSLSEPEATDATERALSLDALRRFLMAPADVFLHQRLGLRLPEVDGADEDVEPLRPPPRGLERNRLQHAVFDAVLAGEDEEALQARLRARGLLPSGPLGRHALADVLAEVRPYARSFARWRGDATAAAAPLRLEVDIDGLRLHGRVGAVWPEGLARLRFGKPNGPSVIRNGLDWLLACAAGETLPLYEFHEGGHGDLGPFRRDALDPAQAKDALRVLIGLRDAGLRAPLVFAPRSGWLFYSEPKGPERGLEEARKQWHGGDRQWGEGGEPAWVLALRARDPFADRDGLREFVRNTHAVFAAVCSGIALPPEIDEALIARAPLGAGDDDE
jgi:exodeoxyribonuclease V gamma subunit